MRKLLGILTVLAWGGLFPAIAYAQGSVTGVVKDSSGAVLPGVTVEASSPALIEKVRSVVTDGTGQYRIVDLRPGTYSVTFTLTGFSTVRREGIELTGSFVATVNADLKVGSLAETITVTGETPDRRRAEREAAADAEQRHHQRRFRPARVVPRPGRRWCPASPRRTQDVGGIAGPGDASRSRSTAAARPRAASRSTACRRRRGRR